MLRLVTPNETPIDTTPRRDVEAEARAEQDRINQTRAELATLRPAWARALIVAELEHDACDPMSDYFNTTTSRRVALAWSPHTRDLFPELRKAAGRFQETAHLGPGCDRYTARVVLADAIVSNGSHYYVDQPSPWHHDLDDNGKTFTTKAAADAFLATAPQPEPLHIGEAIATFRWRLTRESVEHREKYSMGHGYYLKAAGCYASGWKVRKVSADSCGALELELLKPPTAAPRSERPAVEAVTVTPNPDKDGIEIRFPSRPPDDVLDRLKAHGWRWSRFAGCWYRRDSPEARAFAATLTRS